MAELPGFLLRHTVTAEPYEGTGPYGDIYGTGVPVRCFKDDKIQTVRDPDGEEVVSNTTLYARLKHEADLAPRSRITLTGGRTATVITSARRDDGDLGAWQHLEVTLT